MERKPRKPDQAFSERIAAQQISPACRPPAAEPRSDRHPAHEERQHQRLRVGRVADEEFEVVAPDRFVDEPGKAGYGEEQKKYAAGDAAHVDRRTWVGGRWHYTGRVSRSLSTPRKSGKYFFRRAYEILSVVLSFRGDGARRLRDGTDDPRRRRRRRAPAIHVVAGLVFSDGSQRRAGLPPGHRRSRQEESAQPGSG